MKGLKILCNFAKGSLTLNTKVFELLVFFIIGEIYEILESRIFLG